MWPSWAKKQILQAEGLGVTSASSFGCCFPINLPVLGKWKVSQRETLLRLMEVVWDKPVIPGLQRPGKEPLALSGKIA